jgi:hypothetical protein
MSVTITAQGYIPREACNINEYYTALRDILGLSPADPIPHWDGTIRHELSYVGGYAEHCSRSLLEPQVEITLSYSTWLQILLRLGVASNPEDELEMNGFCDPDYLIKCLDQNPLYGRYTLIGEVLRRTAQTAKELKTQVVWC